MPKWKPKFPKNELEEGEREGGREGEGGGGRDRVGERDRGREVGRKEEGEEYRE